MAMELRWRRARKSIVELHALFYILSALNRLLTYQAPAPLALHGAPMTQNPPSPSR